MGNLLKIKMTTIIVWAKFLGIKLWKKEQHVILETINYKGTDYIIKDENDLSLVQSRISTDIANLETVNRSQESSLQDYEVQAKRYYQTDVAETKTSINIAVSKIVNVATQELYTKKHVDIARVISDIGLPYGSVDDQKIFNKFKKRLFNEFKYDYINNMNIDNNNMTIILTNNK